MVLLAKIITMSAGGYKIRNKGAVHFVTFAVVEWMDVFTIPLYKDIVIDSIKYCQADKGLCLHAWCLMTNHIHMVLSAEKHDPDAILRDFKKFTSKKLIAAIETNPKESRRDWMLEIFRRQGQANSRNTNYQFWRQDNHPKELYSPAFTAQKIDYIHQNPVEAGIVDKAEEYLYSSARNYYYREKCGLLDVVYL